MTTLERTNLIIIDDWGPQPLTADQRRDLLEIVDATTLVERVGGFMDPPPLVSRSAFPWFELYQAASASL